MIIRAGCQRRYTAQGVRIVVSHKNQWMERCAVGSLHGQRPLVRIEDLGPIDTIDQRIPLLSEFRIFRDFCEHDESQGFSHFSMGFVNT